MNWTFSKGIPNVQADLSYADDYVISHRSSFTVSYRPPGEHHHVGTFPTLELAKQAAEQHDADRATRKAMTPPEARALLVSCWGNGRTLTSEEAATVEAVARPLETAIETVARIGQVNINGIESFDTKAFKRAVRAAGGRA